MFIRASWVDGVQFYTLADFMSTSSTHYNEMSAESPTIIMDLFNLVL